MSKHRHAGPRGLIGGNCICGNQWPCREALAAPGSVTSADAVRVRAGISRLREQAEGQGTLGWFNSRDTRLMLTGWNPREQDAAHIARWSPQVILALCDDWTRRLDRDEATLLDHTRGNDVAGEDGCNGCLRPHWMCPDARQATESVADLARLIDTINGTGP